MNTTFDNPISVTGGLDIGARSIKMAILSHRGAESMVVAQAAVQIPGCRDVRDAQTAIREGWRQVLREASLSAGDVDNMASTGSGARPAVRVGRVYGHSVQALGARLLFPDATVALEVEGDEILCVLLRDGRGRMRRVECDDPQWAVLARRVAVDLDESSAPSAGVPLPECLVTRAAILLCSPALGGKVVVTGEMVLDTGLVQRLWSRLLALQSNVSLLLSPDAIFAGAYGAAILAARRFTRLPNPFVSTFTDRFVARGPDGNARPLN
jgi:benzoyl-CoA reductase subunit D